MLATMARSVSRGMLVVGGVTYRIERTEPHCYSAVRLLDDCRVGTFRTRPTLRLEPLTVEAATLRDIVRAAMRAARTSSVMQAAPALAPDNDVEPQKPPSTLPPATPVAV